MAVKKTATKKAAPKKKASAGSAVAETTAKVGTPKATATKKAVKKAAPKKAAPVKLSESQKKLLDAIHAAKEAGYLADKKGEAKTLESLAGKKLIKRGAKDKTSGAYRYTVSKAGAKHIGSSSPTA
jgi:hypothetical protein